ncbi:MAG: hypothetical protein KDB22_06415 [Planctomycetales bacterium]|nr:hypothetical protein [Planctomycetales bacterium]
MSQDDPLAAVDMLVAAGIHLAVIGGHAVNVHGYLRATEDIDIIFLRRPETEIRLFEVLNELEAYYIGDEIDPATSIELTHQITPDFVSSHHLMMLGSRLGYIDLFDFVPGLPDVRPEDVIGSAINVLGRPFTNLHWLRRMKLAANRPQDRLDLENLPENS